ncbi:hypothetical protein BST91_07470 [Nonlabens tegetincola]|uniref:thioredoxin family protein n=1 Tax=Nonlabens tegetincola TaxID=323273 RepID=UPI000A202706|nr:thioredoxin family protein [Nonlabens tegetincola]ARN71487.1 hypothetical protein BST91_07470 [Nonlabens tegetincola]
MNRILFLLLFISLGGTIQAQDYITDDTFETTAMKSDGQLKVVSFTAAWCGPCKMMKPIFKELNEDNDLDITVYYLDIDHNVTNDVLNIHSVPTIYFIKNGVKMGELIGGRSKSHLLKEINKFKNSEATGEKLDYLPVPSSIEIVAGDHKKLTVKTAQKVWNSVDNLNKLSESIFLNLNNKADLRYGLMLAERSIEIEPSVVNTVTKAYILYKLGESKKAKKALKMAQKVAGDQKVEAIESLLKKLA